jgi:phosphoenolpyruvate-protein phosphotransferase
MPPEVILGGVAAAPGIASGKAVVLDGRHSSREGSVAQPQRPAELERGRAALEAAAADLESIASRLRDEGRGAEADIVDTGALMARDPGLDAALADFVTQGGLPAAAAVRAAADEIAQQLAAIEDPTLALRADDLRSLGRRAAAHATGNALPVMDGVLIAESLGPADVAELSRGVRGVALSGGGVTAHAAIVARSLGLPMVVGLGPRLLEVATGEQVVLDADSGVLVTHPQPARVAAAEEAAARRRLARDRALGQKEAPAITLDGHRVRVLANVAGVAELEEALAQGAEGVGLLRTELLFLDAEHWPSRSQHVRFLTPILAGLAGRTATVRLLDFGGDKTPPFLRAVADRGVALLLGSAQALRDQLAAIVDAGQGTRLRVLIPMVTAVDQVRAVRAMLVEVSGQRPLPELGAMIETPEAAEKAGAIAAETDFLSLGTNDLTQLVLGLDRERSKSAPVNHPAVLRLIDITMRAARVAKIPVDVCGEAGSDPLAMPVLVGLGADELSVAAARVGEVRERIRNLTLAACQSAAAAALLGKVPDASS